MHTHTRNALLALTLCGACSDEAAEAPVFSPAGGIFLQPVNVTLTTPTDPSSIRYTYAPDTPSDTNGTLYSNPIHVTAPVEIRAIAYRQGLDPSAVVSETYEVYQSAPLAPLLDPGPGIYLPPVLVEMTTATPTANIAYTLDGTDPAPGNGLPYSGTPVQIDTTTDLRAVAYEAGILSLVSQATYTIAQGQVATPELAPEPGRLVQFEPVTITSATPGAVIRYTTDGSFPTCTTGGVYAAPLTLQTGDTLSAVACKTGWIDSNMVAGEYEFGRWLTVGFDGAIRKSTDRGATWTIQQQWLGVSFTDVATNGFGDWVAVGQAGAVRYSYDRGETWQASTMDLNGVYAVETDAFGTWVAGGASDLPPQLRDSVDVGASWDTPNAPGTTGAISGIATDGVIWVAVATSGQILRSSNSGVTWTEVHDAPSALNDVATYGSTWVAVGGSPDSLFVTTSTDGGLTWLATANESLPSLVSIDVDESGTFLAVGELTVRSADGLTWTYLPPVAILQTVTSVATDRGGRWLATFDRVVYASDNDGMSWTQLAFLPVGASAARTVFGY